MLNAPRHAPPQERLPSATWLTPRLPLQLQILDPCLSEEQMVDLLDNCVKLASENVKEVQATFCQPEAVKDTKRTVGGSILFVHQAFKGIEASSLETTTNQNPKHVIEMNLVPSILDSPYFIDKTLNSSAVLVHELLDGSNYYTWARSMQRALSIQNKLGFIDGTLTEPRDPADPQRNNWRRCNDIVVTWIHNALPPDIKASTFYTETARQLWFDLEQRYARKNALRLYQIKQSIITLMQNQEPVRVYFSKLKVLIDELMNYEPISNCTCRGLKPIIDYQERDYTMKFLMGMDESYKAMSAQILMMKPLPSLDETFSIIQQEEKRREIYIDSVANRAMAFNIRETNRPNKKTNPNREKYYCTHCKMNGHSLERCYKANPNRPICSNCNLLGHTAEACYKRKNQSKGSTRYHPTIHMENPKEKSSIC